LEDDSSREIVLSNRKKRLVFPFRIFESFITVTVAVGSIFAIAWMGNNIEKERIKARGIQEVTLGFWNTIYIGTRREALNMAVVEEPGGFY
jgi:hypothetical protein